MSRIRSANGRFALQTVESREIIARSATFNPLMAGFLLDSLSQAIDLESARRTAFQNHVPESVIHVNGFVDLLAAMLVGQAFGVNARQSD